MSDLQLSIALIAGITVPDNIGSLYADVIYLRAIDAAGDELDDLPNAIHDTIRMTLDTNLTGTITLTEVLSQSNIEVQFLAGNGSVLLNKTAAVAQLRNIEIILNDIDVKAITSLAPPPPAAPLMVLRQAFFAPVGTSPVSFGKMKLQIAPITADNGGWKRLELDRLFHREEPATTAVAWGGSTWLGIGTIPWTFTHLTVDGSFRATFPQNVGDAWMWWLTGPVSAIGIVLDDLSRTRTVRIGIPLPPITTTQPLDEETDIPADFTEEEVAANPNIYTEDPGEFCKPFKNPERVLGERSFFVILRAEQPVISAEASVKKDPLPVLYYQPLGTMRNDPVSAAPPTSGGTGRSSSPRVRSTVSTPPTSGSLLADDAEISFLRRALPTSYVDSLKRVDRGRTTLDAAHPIQWEGDVSRYQATTVTRGHILEFRMRWRSNGYSLGTVAKTLTLAPRQTKRIQKIEWQRSELNRRQEATQLFDQVSDALTQERTYEDTVQANLSEWARGESRSSMSAAAGGFGFAAGPFIIGGGGGGSNATSSSSQEGGRRTTASEEQRLRDSIRRYGDSLRKLDSMVVTEVVQEETATGTTEVVRNANYGHSLTLIYYQILRHLKIETSVAGVRECLFVPFAIIPFTVSRAYRWRDSLQTRMRNPRFIGSLTYLKDVENNFENSDVPLGNRSEQPVRHIFGSLFLKLAVERPTDQDDGGFNADTWGVVRPFLGSPALSIFNRIKALAEAQRDAIFQQQHAPAIAASWVDTLEMSAGTMRLRGAQFNADFTLATRYQFNGVLRVDFSVPAPSGVTRETLSSITVKATKALPPGSIANLQSLTFTYATDQFQRNVTLNQGAKDLVEIETGEPDSGATFTAIPDPWERQDIRAEMTSAVHSLIEHLNEHVEYYNKVILWNMDRDRLFMLIDGFYAPGTNGVSIASVVERDPIAIVGNSIVFRVSAGSFLGIGNITTPGALFNHYALLESPTAPMLVSLPTDGLYAQTVMDDCPALEEHFGNTDWVLNDPDPALGEIVPELLASRRAEPQGTQPAPLPQTLINLQNAPPIPVPSGLAGAFSAVTNPNAFRDMAGLAGTQANAAAAFQTAANLATNFGNQAAAIKLADMAKNTQATQMADQKLATVQRALDLGLATPEEGQKHTSRILADLYGAEGSSGSGPITVADVEKLVTQSGQNKTKLNFSNNLGEMLGIDGSGVKLANAPEPLIMPSTTGPAKMEWADGIDLDNIPVIAALLREEFNLRLDQGIFEGPTAWFGMGLTMFMTLRDTSEAKRRTRETGINRLIEKLRDDQGKRDIAEAIMLVNASVALQISKVLKPQILSGTSLTEIHIPISIIYLSQQLGMLLAWLDIAILQEIENEGDRIRALKEEWLYFPTVLTGLLPSIASFSISSILDVISKEFDGQFTSYTSALRAFRRSFTAVGEETLKEVLNSEVPQGLVFSNFGFAANHGAYLLRGWDEENKFLGERP